MAKKSALVERYVSEDTRKRSQKRTTVQLCVFITIILVYVLGYSQYLKHSGMVKNDTGLFELIELVGKRVTSFDFLYPINSFVLMGWLIGVILGGFIYFVINLDNERHRTTNMERSAGTGGFMPALQKEEYDKLYKTQDPPPIVDYDKVDIKGKSWDEIKSLYSENMINSKNFTRPINSRSLIGNNNVLIVGGAGTGKSRFYGKPNILQMNASYIITDPSGEMIVSLGNVLSKNGYKIKIFNISNKRYSNTYNPLKYVRTEEDVNILISCLIDNTTKGEGGGENQFFVDAEKLLYSACIFYLIDFCRDESKKNFAGVMDMINSSNVDEKNADNQSDLDKLFAELPQSSLARKYYRAFKQAAGKTLKSIIISCVTRLQPFLIPQIVSLTKTDELELEKIGDERTALFIITPQADRTYSFLASILYSQLFMTLYDVAEKRKASIGDERLPIPVRCIMDEFANIGTVPAFDEKLATMRKYNISAVVVLQNLSQIEAMYAEKHKTIIGNCSTIIFLGSSEKENLEYFSELLGEETIKTKSTSVNNGNKGGSSISYQYTSRAVMSPNELGVLPPDECIVFTQGFRPVRDFKYDYTNHPYFPQTGDADPTLNFSYMDVSTFDNSNTCKYENLLIAQGEIKKYKKRALEIKNAEGEKITENKTADEINNSDISETEKKMIIRNYENYYITEVYKDAESIIPVVKAENIPTKFLSEVYNIVSNKTGIKDIVMFTNTQNTDEVLLGCVNDNLKPKVLENNITVVDMQQSKSGNWLFLIKTTDYDEFKNICQK